MYLGVWKVISIEYSASNGIPGGLAGFTADYLGVDLREFTTNIFTDVYWHLIAAVQLETECGRKRAP
jgi:hypothetical protein